MTESPLALDHFDVDLTYDGRVLEVSINRRPVNALTKQSYEEIRAICEFVAGHATASALLLRSSGRLFSAGADKNALQGVSERVAAERRDLLRAAIVDLFTCAVPVITAVNGAAVGAGAVFAAAGDIVVASDDAFVALPEIDIALIGGARGLARMVSPQRLRALALTGARISAQELHRIGSIEEVVPSSQLLKCARGYANAVASKGYHTARKWKEALTAIEGSGLTDGLLIEQSLSLSLTSLNSQ